MTIVTDPNSPMLDSEAMSSLAHGHQRFRIPKPAKRSSGPPGAGYFALNELQELNSGYYHDAGHALEVAELVRELAIVLGRAEPRAEFLRQVALIHDADPRLCAESGEQKKGTPARVQVTLSWMLENRDALEQRFGWEGFQFAEACALIARTDFPFDQAPRRCGTAFDGMSPVEVYREQLWKLPEERRRQCFADALLLRFADQMSCYVDSYERAQRSVVDLAKELQNTGAAVTFEDISRNTPQFLDQVGLDLTFDKTLQAELNLDDVSLPSRTELIAALGWKRRTKLAWNTAKFRFLGSEHAPEKSEM